MFGKSNTFPIARTRYIHILYVSDVWPVRFHRRFPEHGRRFSQSMKARKTGPWFSIWYRRRTLLVRSRNVLSWEPSAISIDLRACAHGPSLCRRTIVRSHTSCPGRVPSDNARPSFDTRTANARKNNGKKIYIFVAYACIFPPFLRYRRRTLRLSSFLTASSLVTQIETRPRRV